MLVAIDGYDHSAAILHFTPIYLPDSRGIWILLEDKPSDGYHPVRLKFLLDSVQYQNVNKN